MSSKKIGLNAGKMRYRKVLRDNIQGITSPAIKRLAQKGGAKRVDHLIFEEIRGIMRLAMENILKDAITHTEHERRKTVSLRDMVRGIDDATGVHLAVGKDMKTKQCSVASKKTVSTSEKPHRFKPGTVSLRKIRKYQSQSACLYIPQAAFKRLTRELAQDYKEDLRFSEDAVIALQYYIEGYLVELLGQAAICAMHDGKRATVMVKDLKLVRTVRKETAGCFL